MVRMALQNKKGIALAIIALLGYGNYNEKRSVLVIKGEKAIQPLLDYLEKYPLKYRRTTGIKSVLTYVNTLKKIVLTLLQNSS